MRRLQPGGVKLLNQPNNKSNKQDNPSNETILTFSDSNVQHRRLVVLYSWQPGPTPEPLPIKPIFYVHPPTGQLDVVVDRMKPGHSFDLDELVRAGELVRDVLVAQVDVDVRARVGTVAVAGQLSRLTLR